MKNSLVLLLLSLLWTQLSFAQNEDKYAGLIKVAEKQYDEKAFQSSAESYNAAFVILGNKGYINDRYNAACSWALANQVDSAFVQLFKIAKSGSYTNYSHLSADSDLSSLYGDSRWEEVKKLVLANKEKKEANYDKPLVAKLDSIYEDDQSYRRQISDIDKEFGWESPEMKAHWKIIQAKDSV